MSSHRMFLLAVLLGTAACAHRAPQPEAKARPIATEGSRLAVPGGTIWYRVVGGGPGTPLVLLHGGPGGSSVYLRSMEALASERVVVRYDQLGGGKSDVVKDTALFNVDHFVEELDSLRRFLGLQRVHVYGHSWGATLAVEYYRAHPQHVASLVLASGALNMPAFYAHVAQLMARLPEAEARAIRQQDLGQPYDTAALQAAAHDMNTRYMTRHPVIAEMDTFDRSLNPAIGDHMNGSSALRPNGTLKDYDASPFLRQVRVPTLFIVGEYDIMDPETIRAQAQLTPGARFVVIPGSAHNEQWDNPTANNEAIRAFLRDVDARPRR